MLQCLHLQYVADLTMLRVWAKDAKLERCYVKVAGITVPIPCGLHPQTCTFFVASLYDTEPCSVQLTAVMSVLHGVLEMPSLIIEYPYPASLSTTEILFYDTIRGTFIPGVGVQ